MCTAKPACVPRPHPPRRVPQLTGSIIRLADLEPEFQDLCRAMLVKRDRARLLEGKPKYETVEGMIEAYVELGSVSFRTAAEAGLEDMGAIEADDPSALEDEDFDTLGDEAIVKTRTYAAT